MLKNRLLTIFLVGVVPLLTWGQTTPASKIEPEKAALIEEMFKLTKTEDMMKQVLEQYKTMFSANMEKSFTAQIRQSGDKNDYTPEVREFQNKVFALLSDRMRWTLLKPKLAALYDQTFTKQELADIVAFYKTPTGQSALVKMPALSGKAMQLGQEQVGDVTPEIQKMSAQFAAEVKKKHDSTTPPAATKK